jgi:hypothetical protein
VPFRLAGRLTMIGTAATFISGIAAAVLTGHLMIDVAALIVYFLGQSAAQGSRRAAKWALGFMALYVAMAVVFLVTIAVAPERLLIGMKPVSPDAFPWIQAIFAAIGIWAATCAGLLIRGLWQTRSRAISPLN